MAPKNSQKAAKSKFSANKNKGGVSKSKAKAKSKSTKHKIDKLNSNLDEINEVKQLLGSGAIYAKSKTVGALDAKTLRKDVIKDREIKAKNKLIENDLKNQMDMIKEMEF